MSGFLKLSYIFVLVLSLTPFIHSINPFRRSPLSLLNPSSASLWDPLDSWSLWNHEPAFSFAKDIEAVANTRVDWKETDDAHIITVDLPGIKKEDLKVEVEDRRILKISGERKKEEVQESDKYHVVERSSGKFLRQFRLPENADMESINAKFENGMLVVKVAKREVPKAERIKSIEIEGIDESEKIEAVRRECQGQCTATH